MENACQDDATAHEAGRPATHKLKLLPEVVALLNRTSVQHAVLDPENNVLQNVKFFLEPLNDGTMPAYNVQRDLLNALLALPIEKETLMSSGIGKVILFYTRSKRPEVGIKRMAERLLGQWSRPLLNRTDDYRKRRIETREFDYAYELLSLFCIFIYCLSLFISPVLQLLPTEIKHCSDRVVSDLLLQSPPSIAASGQRLQPCRTTYQCPRGGA